MSHRSPFSNMLFGDTMLRKPLKNIWTPISMQNSDWNENEKSRKLFQSFCAFRSRRTRVSIIDYRLRKSWISNMHCIAHTSRVYTCVHVCPQNKSAKILLLIPTLTAAHEILVQTIYTHISSFVAAVYTWKMQKCTVLLLEIPRCTGSSVLPTLFLFMMGSFMKSDTKRMCGIFTCNGQLVRIFSTRSYARCECKNTTAGRGCRVELFTTIIMHFTTNAWQLGNSIMSCFLPRMNKWRSPSGENLGW